MKSKRNSLAFSMLEVLLVVAVLGSVAALAISSMSGVVESSREQKLNSDVDSINRSISAYLASGGDLSSAKTADDVLSALKQSVASGNRIPGWSGSKLDVTITTESQTASEAQAGELRAYWDESKQRFYTSSSGSTPGVKRFVRDSSLDGKDYGETKANFAFTYSAEDSWIWDYQDVANPVGTLAPSTIAVASVPSNTLPPPTAVPVPPPPPVVTNLDAPAFSLPGGNYPISQFSNPVTLSNPNPAGSSTLYYSIDYGEWQPYQGPITVSPGSTLSAQAVTSSASYNDSSRVNETYSAENVTLLSPIISPDRSDFGLFSGRTINVDITNPNDPTISTLEYRLGGDPWQSYTTTFSVERSDYPDGVLVQARVVSANPYYLDSSSTLRTLSIEQPEINGDLTGNFSDPAGQIKMETNLAGGFQNNYFEWGRDYFDQADIDYFFGGDAALAAADAAANPLSKSWLDFDSINFNAVTTGERFQIGNLSYYNGSIVADTGAESVNLGLDLNFDISGVTAATTLDFNLELINVPNYEDPNDPWRDADYVKLANPIASETLIFNDIEFQFQIEFGETTADGISYFDEFHVLEAKDASTKVYGTLIEIGEVDPAP